MIKFRFFSDFFRYICYSDIRTVIIIEDIGIHFEQIYDTLEVFFLTDGDLDHDRIFAQSVPDLINAAVIIRADHIHFVDERHPGNIIGICLTPDVFGLGFDTALGRKNAECTVKDTQRTFNFNCKVYVSGRIDDIDTMLQGTFFVLVVILQCPVAGSSG